MIRVIRKYKGIAMQAISLLGQSLFAVCPQNFLVKSRLLIYKTVFKRKLYWHELAKFICVNIGDQFFGKNWARFISLIDIDNDTCSCHT